MRQYIFVGGSHGIARAAVEQLLLAVPDAEVFVFSREAGPWAEAERVTWRAHDVLKDAPLDLADVDFADFGGYLYAPGSLGLRPFPSLKLEDFRRDYEINLVGNVRCLQQILPLAKAARGVPSFVFFSTVAALRGLSFHASIASAKAAVEGLTRTLAVEYAPHLRFNCLAPSLTDTELTASLVSKESVRKQSEDRHPLKRIGTSADIAAAAVYLLTDASAWMTGQVLRPDGGFSL